MSEIQCGWPTEGPILAAPEYSVFSYTEVLSAVPPPWGCPFAHPPGPNPLGPYSSPDYPVPFSAPSPVPGLLFTAQEQGDLGIIQTMDN